MILDQQLTCRLTASFSPRTRQITEYFLWPDIAAILHTSPVLACITDHSLSPSRHMNSSAHLDRRQFARCTALATAATLIHPLPSLLAAPGGRDPKLAGAIGIVSASAAAQLTGRSTNGKFTLLDLPKILRDELDMRVLDLNTSSFPDFAKVDGAYLNKLRAAADDAKCVLTNLKMNQRDLDMNSPDSDVRQKALREYKRSIDVASELGCRWVRPLPLKDKPDLRIHIDSYRELCDYATPRNVQLLIENFGWMQGDVNSVADLVKQVGHNVAAGVDTGNWNNNAIRYDALKRTFPQAVTCDFKARQLGDNGEHPLYDLKRCFQIGWDSGFRGPWALEHGHRDTKVFFRDLVILRDMIRKWSAS